MCYDTKSSELHIKYHMIYITHFLLFRAGRKMNDKYMKSMIIVNIMKIFVPFLLSRVFSFPKDKNIVMVMATYRASQN